MASSPTRSSPVSEDDVLRFLGRMNEAGEDGDRIMPFRTILFTDLQGSTAILQDVGQAAFMVLFDGARPDHPASARVHPRP